MEENALNVVMIGASRSGKTSILASMLEQIRYSAIGDYFFVEDKSEYCYGEGDKRASEVSLRENVNAMKDLLNPQLDGGKSQPKLAELTGTTAPFTYDFSVQSITEKCKVEKEILHVKFTDVKGETFANGGKELDAIVKIIKTAQVLLVAVDVPALMYVKDKNRNSLNEFINLKDTFLSVVDSLGQDFNEPDLMKMIAFIPIKCEYWMHHNKMEEVYDEIKKVYERGLARANNAGNIRVMIMPMETIGGLEFDHYSEDDNSYLLMYGEPQKTRNNADIFIEEDYIGNNGAVRCEKVSENQVRIKNGVIYSLQPSDKLILAKERGRYPYVYNAGGKPVGIPFFWFIPTGNGYQPRYCEQALFQVLKFAIESIEKTKNVGKENVSSKDENLSKELQELDDFTLNPFKLLYRAVKRTVILVSYVFKRFGFLNEEQCLKFSENIRLMQEEGIISEDHIRYLIKKENGVDLLNIKE